MFNVSITKDAHVVETFPTTNYANQATLDVYAYDPNNERRTFIDWDLSSVNMADAVDVTLFIYQVSSEDHGNANIRSVLGPWTESGLTWNTMPLVSYNAVKLNCSGQGWRSLDITPMVASELMGHGDYYGIEFSGNDSANNTLIFISSEFGDPSLRPYVRVRTLADVGYDYSNTDINVYSGSRLYCTPTSYVQVQLINGSNEQALLNILTPWDYMYSDVILDADNPSYNKIVCENDSAVGYSEYFIVQLNYTFAGIESNSANLSYRWFREYNDRYVATTGLDTNTGRSWLSPFKTVAKGFAETPSGGRLFVEAGMYSETLANLTLASDRTSIQIHPTSETHVNTDAASVIIGTGSIYEHGFDTDSSGALIAHIGYTRSIFMTTLLRTSRNLRVQKISTRLCRSAVGGSTVRVRAVVGYESGSANTFVVTDYGEWSELIHLDGGESVIKNNIYSSVNTGDGYVVGMEVMYVSNSGTGVGPYYKLGTTGYNCYVHYTNTEVPIGQSFTCQYGYINRSLRLRIAYFE